MSSSPAPQESARQPSDKVQKFSDKVQRIQREVPAWIQAHPDRKPELASLFQQLDNNVRAHKMSQAEQAADAILRLIQTNPNPN